jgi:hypothetical protein
MLIWSLEVSCLLLSSCCSSSCRSRSVSARAPSSCIVTSVSSASRWREDCSSSPSRGHSADALVSSASRSSTCRAAPRSSVCVFKIASSESAREASSPSVAPSCVGHSV